MAVLRVALLLLGLVAFALAADSDVVTLTDATFDSAIAADASSPWLVELYAAPRSRNPLTRRP